MSRSTDQLICKQIVIGSLNFYSAVVQCSAPPPRVLGSNLLVDWVLSVCILYILPLCALVSSKFKDVLVMVNCLIKTGCRCGELVVASLCAAKPVQAEPSLY